MNIFQQITDYVKRDHTTFTMNNNWLGSVNGFGSLNNIYRKVVIAGDTWKVAHNVMVKLPPLISPAFTRIKGIINTYYCSYASVWNYWNSFISDKPEDVFLSRSLTASYKGKFVEPCIQMKWIAFILKLARGYFFYDANESGSGRGIYADYSVTGKVTINVATTYFTPGLSTDPSPSTSIVWSVDGYGRRKATLTNMWTSLRPYYQYDYTVNTSFTFSIPSTTFFEDLGFADIISYLIYQCQEVERNLSNHGDPTDMIARSSMTFFGGDLFNALNYIAESSIWQNFYRDEQNQSPEPDYREINGLICSVNPNTTDSQGYSIPSGWKIRLLGIPPNVSTGSDYWWSITTMEDIFSLLTGFMFEEQVKTYIMSRNSATDIIILPKFYNGLMVLKYRNFEKDYFTSACVDPNYGGVSVTVPNTIDALRTASKLEEFLEVSASARDFYNFMKTIFGTNPESTRYQKPLLLGTQVIPVQISEQLQTSQTTTGLTGSPLGERAGVADGYGNSGTANHFFNEHGIIVSYLSFVLDSQYMQGLPFEDWHRLQLDYPWPQFANLGAESIPLKEIYYGDPEVRGVSYKLGDNNAVLDNSTFVPNQVDSDVLNGNLYPPPSIGANVGLNVDIYDVMGVYNAANVAYQQAQSDTTPNVFGYTPRYSRWKFAQDVVAGQMRDSLEFWHTFRHFNERPYISNNFVSYMNAGFLSNLNRIFAVENDNSDKFVVDIFNNCSVRRCLPLMPQTTMD